MNDGLFSFPSPRVGGGAYRTTAYSLVTSGVWQVVKFEGISFAYSGVVVDYANGVIMAVEPGLYTLFGYAPFAANATGFRVLAIRINGGELVRQALLSVGAGGSTDVNVAGLYPLVGGEKIELWAWQNSGGALNISAAPLPLLGIAKL